jgi:hypothetical protein
LAFSLGPLANTLMGTNVGALLGTNVGASVGNKCGHDGAAVSHTIRTAVGIMLSRGQPWAQSSGAAKGSTGLRGAWACWYCSHRRVGREQQDEYKGYRGGVLVSSNRWAQNKEQPMEVR